MKFRPEFSPLVIIGQWNKSIFNLNWVQKYILPEYSGVAINVDFPMLGADLSPKYITDKFSFNTQGERLVFNTASFDDETLRLVSKKAIALVGFLEYTPVESFGINHLFECDDKDNFDLATFNNIEEPFNKCGDVVHSRIVKAYKLQDYVLTIVTHLQKNAATNNIIFDFNYSYEIKDLSEFKIKFTEESIVERKNDALHILEDLFNLKLSTP
jgi:hypothetical protein